MKLLTRLSAATVAERILIAIVVLYAIYFSGISVMKYRNLYASYYDLGIMNQTVHNTYKAITTGDWSRFLLLTEPAGSAQLYRPAIHNDIILALFAPFYFLHDGPETLLIIQVLVAALGAFAVFGITKRVLDGYQQKDWLTLGFSAAYLLYPPMQHGSTFEMHAFTLVTTLLLFAFLLCLKKSYHLSFLFIALALITKENVGLSVAMLGGYWIYKGIKNKEEYLRNFGIAVAVLSVVWFSLSVLVITPHFRATATAKDYFATEFYSEFGDSPKGIITGVFTKPGDVVQHLGYPSARIYLSQLLGPFGFLSLAAPLELASAIPELAVNLLSSNHKMRSIEYHYTALIEFFIIISAIYGARRIAKIVAKDFSKIRPETAVLVWLLAAAFGFSLYNGLMPYSSGSMLSGWASPMPAAKEALEWQERLKDEDIKISVTHDLAPIFSGRKYLYEPGPTYTMADYVILSSGEPLVARQGVREGSGIREVYGSGFYVTLPTKETIALHEAVSKDRHFKRIYHSDSLEVYQKIQ